MTIYTVGVRFDSKPDSKVYDYYTIWQLQPEDEAVIKLQGRHKVVKVATAATEELSPSATDWIRGWIDYDESELLATCNELLAKQKGTKS